jgi:hypothetical protein
MSVTLPSVTDPLGDALHFLRMSGVFYCRSEFTAPWSLALPAMSNFLMLHVVTSGRCWLEVEETEGRLLQPGDLALLPHGQGHQIASDLGMVGAKLFEIPRVQVSERYEILRLGGGGAPATVARASIATPRNDGRSNHSRQRPRCRDRRSQHVLRSWSANPRCTT